MDQEDEVFVVGRANKSWALVCCVLTLYANFSFAESLETKILVKAGIPAVQTPPLNVIPKSNSEYYSSIPGAKVQIPVHIWGEVPSPGLHYVPRGSTLMQAVSLAGGPSATASLPEVRFIRGNEVTYIDLLGPGLKEEVLAYDTLYVERSFKSDLPLFLPALTAILSIVSLYLVATNQRK